MPLLLLRLDASSCLAGSPPNTLLVVTPLSVQRICPQGEQVGEHGLWWKQTFYEDSIRVPGILCWAGTPDEEQRRALPAGHRCDRVTSTLDISATMLDALDAPSLPSSPGRSLMPLLHEGTSKVRTYRAIRLLALCYMRWLRCGSSGRANLGFNCFLALSRNISGKTSRLRSLSEKEWVDLLR